MIMLENHNSYAIECKCEMDPYKWLYKEIQEKRALIF